MSLALLNWKDIVPQTETEQLLLTALKQMEERINSHIICPVYRVLTRTALEERWKEAKKIPHLAIAFLDVDHLKQANNKFGQHEANRRLAEAFSLARHDEIIGRFYYGDELIILAPMHEIRRPVLRIMQALRDREMSATVAIAPYKGEASLNDATKVANDKVLELKAKGIRGIACILD